MIYLIARFREYRFNKYRQLYNIKGNLKKANKVKEERKKARRRKDDEKKRKKRRTEKR